MSIDESPRRIAVFSDIHGNLQALDAVLAAIDKLEISDTFCCGDVVGYGAYPNECCERLSSRNIPTLAGNHDHACIGQIDSQFFNEIAKAAVKWTIERLTLESKDWLKNLPYTGTLGNRHCFAHASPFEPEKWGYVLTFQDARTAFESFEQDFCFIGHSHQPAIVEKDGEELLCPEGFMIDIVDGRRYLINVGSVGQPRDRNPKPCFVVVDLDTKKIEFHRVEYDINSAQAAIRDADLPEELAERIGYGW
jgi:diadenosine tetraphosphatase ApaH/serine/threonine PP2A family protein phosphatase